MIAIVDSGGANINSILFALERLGYQGILTHDAKTIEQASHVILPGVGCAAVGMRALAAFSLVPVIKGLRQPVLGICLGMQLLYDYSEEGNVACLGIIPGSVKKIELAAGFRVPHMGWNVCNSNIVGNEYVYFVHSYYVELGEYTLASTYYGKDFSAIVKKDNFIGMQFHPEKSGEIGQKMLKKFLELSL